MPSRDIQFENINSLRKYPFAEDATMLSDKGEPIPVDIIKSLHITSLVSVDDVFCSGIHCGPRLVSISLSDKNGILLSCTCPGNISGTNDEYIEMTSHRKGVSGTISLYNPKTDSASAVTYRASTPAQTRIHRFCILEFPEVGVVKFIDDKSGEEISGQVTVKFNGGAVGASIAEQDTHKTTIKLSLNKNLASILSNPCIPTDLNTSCIAPVIQTINGVEPTEDGEIAIVLE